MKYFARIVIQYTSKNALAKTISEEVRHFDCTLLYSRDLILDYIEELENLIENANELHPRCKPRQLEIIDIEESDPRLAFRISLRGEPLFYIHVYPILKEVES